MENNELQELIGSFTGMVSELKDSIQQLKEQFDSIMDGANAAYSDWDHSNKKKEFSERNKDFLDKYSAKLAAIEGDEFDLAEEAMKVPEGADEAQYIAALAESIDEQLDKLREALGEANVEATNVEGDTEITASSNEVADEPVAEVTESEEPSKSDEEILAEEVEAEKNKDRSLK